MCCKDIPYVTYLVWADSFSICKTWRICVSSILRMGNFTDFSNECGHIYGLFWILVVYHYNCRGDILLIHTDIFQNPILADLFVNRGHFHVQKGIAP